MHMRNTFKHSGKTLVKCLVILGECLNQIGECLNQMVANIFLCGTDFFFHKQWYDVYFPQMYI